MRFNKRDDARLHKRGNVILALQRAFIVIPVKKGILKVDQPGKTTGYPLSRV